MTDRATFHKVLRALGAVKIEDSIQGLADRHDALTDIISQLNDIKHDVANKLRVAQAEVTRDQRLKPSDPFYWTHMRHCYGLSYDDVIGDEIPTERYECKYGDDHICPAALFEDPWAEYERAKKSGEIAW